MKFTEITVHTSSEGSELVADVLWDYSHYGVAIRDARDVIDLASGKTGAHFDYLDPALGGGETLVKGYLPEPADEAAGEIRARLEELRARSPFALGSLETALRSVDGDEWREIWKKHFRPLPIGLVTVVPEWIDYRAKDGETVLKIDSNMAFGTGEHETTALCLEFLQRYGKRGDTVLDAGCGSGILGISAVLLGAERAILTDVDEVAVRSARHNALLNGIADRCEVVKTSLLDGVNESADLILANITAEILVRLAPAAKTHLRQGGRLVLGGIIHSRLDLVLRAFVEEEGFVLLEKRSRGEWNALALGRE